MTETRSAQDWFAEFILQSGAIDKVAKFCKVTSTAVLTWQNGKWPRGEQVYRLWALLEFSGLKVAELEELPTPMHRLALLMASDILSYEEVAEFLEYKNLSSLYYLLRNEGAPDKAKVWKIQKLVEEYGSVLDQYIQEFEGREVSAPVVANKPHVQSVVVPAKVTPQPVQVAVVEANADTSVDLTAKLLRQLLRRFERVDVDALAKKVDQDIPSAQIEELAVFLLELV